MKQLASYIASTLLASSLTLKSGSNLDKQVIEIPNSPLYELVMNHDNVSKSTDLLTGIVTYSVSFDNYITIFTDKKPIGSYGPEDYLYASEFKPTDVKKRDSIGGFRDVSLDGYAGNDDAGVGKNDIQWGSCEDYFFVNKLKRKLNKNQKSN